MSARAWGVVVAAVLLVGSACSLACDGRGGAADEPATGGAGGGAGVGGAGGAGAGGVGGAAGSAGTGGSGGEGGGGSGGRGGLDWLTGSEGWERVPGSELVADFCVVEQSGAAHLRYPPVVFDRPCGIGCDRADVVQGFGPLTDRPALSTLRALDGSGHGYLSVSHIPKDGLFVPIRRLVRLSDGYTVGAVRQTREPDAPSSSTFGAATQDAELVIVIARHTASGRGGYGFGLRQHTDESWRWPSPWRLLDPVDSGCATFVAEGSNALFKHCGTVYVEDLGVGAARVDLQQVGVQAGAGEGELGVWTLASNGVTSRLMGWTRPSGVVELTSALPGESCAVGVGPAGIAGFLGLPGSDGGCPGIWQEPRAYWMPRAPGPSVGRLVVSPTLGAVPLAPMKVVTWGDFVALDVVTRPDDVYPSGRQHLYLWRPRDGLMRRIEAREGHVIYQYGLTLTERYLYVAEVPIEPNDRYLYELTRYDLAHAAELGVAP